MYRWIVIFKGAAGSLGQPGPEGTEGPKVSVYTKYMWFSEKPQARDLYVNYSEATCG